MKEYGVILFITALLYGGFLAAIFYRLKTIFRLLIISIFATLFVSLCFFYLG